MAASPFREMSPENLGQVSAARFLAGRQTLVANPTDTASGVALSRDAVDVVAAVAVPETGEVSEIRPFLRLSPEMLGRLGRTPAPAPLDNLPLADSANGSVFEDRLDGSLRWYLPAVTLVDPDGAFAFAASQKELGDGGLPFPRASLTAHIRVGDPPDLAGARAALPSATFRPIPLIGVDATLDLPYTDSGGNPQVKRFPAIVDPPEGDTHRIFVDGLLGEDVVLAYTQLRLAGQATITVTVRYRAARAIARPTPFPDSLQLFRPLEATTPLLVTVAPTVAPTAAPMVDPTFARVDRSVLFTAADARTVRSFDTSELRVVSDDDPDRRFTRIRDHRRLPPFPVDDGGDDQPKFMEFDVGKANELALATIFGTGDYPTKFTLTTKDTTRPIIDEHDLTEFHVNRSEFQELTSLGNIQALFPSFRRVYVGVVTGTVIAVPVTYGIARGAWGCAARCDAIVDERPNTITGCQFHLTFAICPIVDPIDLAKLTDALQTTPEAQRLKLHLQLPTGLDHRQPSTLEAPMAEVTFADGLDPTSLLLSVDIQDTDVPAINKVNVFLAALRARISTPLFGHVAVRIDDIMEPPVTTMVVLNFHATGTVDNSDIVAALADDRSTATISNASPFEIRVTGCGTFGATGLVVSDADLTLKAGASGQVTLAPGTEEGSPLLVRRSPALAEAASMGELSRFMTFNTQTVSQSRFVFGINATGVDLSTVGASEMSIQIALTDHPTLSISRIVITPLHRIDSVEVLVPIDAVVNGLHATVAIRLTTPGGPRDVELSNDFWEDPIFVVPQAPLLP